MIVRRAAGGLAASAGSVRLFALSSIGLGIMLSLGTYNPGALVLVSLGAGLAGFSVRLERTSVSPLQWALAVGLSVCACWMYTNPYGMREALPLAALTACIGAAFVIGSKRQRSMVLAGAGCAAIGVAVVPWTWGYVIMDSFRTVQVGAEQLLEGGNPYAPTVMGFAPLRPGVAGIAPMHLQYGPAVPLLAAPARALGDVRVLTVVACAVFVAATWSLAGQGRVGVNGRWRMVALAIASPFFAAMVVNGWVDMLCLAGFAGWLAWRDRHRSIGIAGLAVALATKPTIIVALVPFVVWSRAARRDSAIAAASALAVAVPFMLLTGVHQFLYDIIGFQADYPTRFDGLTVNALLFHAGRGPLPGWLSTAIVAAACTPMLLRRPRDVGDLCTSGAVLATVGFLFAKWAYFNYYAIPAALLLLAVAGDGVAVGQKGDVRHPIPRQIGRLVARRAGSMPATS